MPAKLPAPLPNLSPLADALLKRADLLLQFTNTIAAALNGRSYTDIDLAGSLAVQEAPVLTILAGAISIATGTGQNIQHYGNIVVAAETGQSDDLDTVNGGRDGQLLTVWPDSGDIITVRSGTGNIDGGVGGDAILSGSNMGLLLVYRVSLLKWVILSRSG